MSVIPEESGRETTDLPDNGLGFMMIVLLALADSGAPSYDHDQAATLAALGVPAFACTQDQFPELLAVTLGGGDVGLWVSQTVTARA